MIKRLIVVIIVGLMVISCNTSDNPQKDRERHEKAEQIRSKKRLEQRNKKAMEDLRDRSNTSR